MAFSIFLNGYEINVQTKPFWHLIKSYIWMKSFCKMIKTQNIERKDVQFVGVWPVGNICGITNEQTRAS
ncbi:unnamed protein product [Adineta ricciae]|uniref:Uncharacterized protein n=1 Tax=Adineta ricciae TaxID=249248 RepID=A0A814VX34_ADIRI|nr:unnamed protein product [Adineta ricciae]